MVYHHCPLRLDLVHLNNISAAPLGAVVLYKNTSDNLMRKTIKNGDCTKFAFGNKDD